MTLGERVEMYKNKKRFIENLNEVFQIAPGCPSIEGIHYEVYTKDCGEGRIDEREWVIVHFTGGAKSVKIVSGNSNIANFRVVGSLLSGGYYAEVRTYQEQLDNGYRQVKL